ncbi:MAG: glycosyltransferase [Armatimonadetes bacterium]|nr:glycosyltransferase [Armatimonadota bacterium]
MDLRILQINTYDVAGGAERIALTLHQAYRALGHDAWLVVRQRKTSNEAIVELDEMRFAGGYGRFWRGMARLLRPLDGKVRGASRARRCLEACSRPGAMVDSRLGREDFNYPSSRHLLEHIPAEPDIIHCHNLHGGYFDLRTLPWLSTQKPVVVTLHDEWMLTGHCSYAVGCERWQSGCGECPDLNLPPVVRRDATALNWQRKKQLLEGSRLYIAAPSQWLIDRAKKSILAPAAVGTRVIRNGVDLSVFHPAAKQESRERIGVPADADVLLFVAQGAKSNPFKDYTTLRSAVATLAQTDLGRPLVFIAIGQDARPEQIGRAQIRFVPFTTDAGEVATYYRAADIYIHAARSDNFPTTILESLACGTPVVATAVGGIPEQVEDGVNGCLVPPSDPHSMAEAVIRLLKDRPARTAMSEAAARAAVARYDHNKMVHSYLAWYEEIVRQRLGRP